MSKTLSCKVAGFVIRILMSFALEPEIVTLTWIDNASVQIPLEVYATKALNHRPVFESRNAQEP